MSLQNLPYRVEMLPSIPAYFKQAWRSDLDRGQLVYYGPMPQYYGIGEIQSISEKYIVVDFRGTGEFGIHEDVFEKHYLIPIPASRINLL